MKGSIEYLELPFEHFDDLSGPPVSSGTLSITDGSAELLNVNIFLGFTSRGYAFSALLNTTTLDVGRYPCEADFVIGGETAKRRFDLVIE
jgi:hypothetical protein